MESLREYLSTIFGGLFPAHAYGSVACHECLSFLLVQMYSDNFEKEGYTEFDFIAAMRTAVSDITKN